VALVDLKFDPKSLERIASALERLADCAERAFPKPSIPLTGTPAPPENLTVFNPEDEWEREQEDERRAMLGLPPLRS
jgi:hypothetical protein